MKALVLNSGGMDSTVCTGMAVDKYGAENVVTVSIYYGQRHDKELQCARDIAEYYGVRHIEKDVSSIMEYSNEVCTLLKTSTKDVKDSSYAEQIAENGEGRVATYVSYRNGLFLSIAAALADGIFNGQEAVVVYGAHADDAAGQAYADCSPEFADAQDKAISIGTYGKIHVWRPLINWNKSEVCKEGLRLHVPFHLTTSCYHGRDKACGCCGTCLDRIAAFRANGVIDPIEYDIELDWGHCNQIQGK